MQKIGLTEEEVKLSKDQYGDNSISEEKGRSFWKKLLENLRDPMIKILCVALAINIIFAFLGQTEWYESVGIALAVILATFVSTFSEYRNENAFQKLQEEASKITCKVYRDGEVKEIGIDNIVVGDCVLLQAGDKIPADGVLIDGSIKVDQSVLNGESLEAEKIPVKENEIDQEEAMDFLNPHKVYRGAVVCTGNGIMKVTTVGNQSVYGKIASELQIEEERESPLKLKLAKLANGISKFGYIGGVTIAIVFLFQKIIIQNQFNLTQITTYCSDWMTVANDMVEAVMLAVIVIVMAVPEGLPLMIALVSALNMGKMLRDNVLVRKIVGIETAGSLNLLFSDKTGTITKGQLEAVIFVNGEGKEYKERDKIDAPLENLLTLSIKHNTDAMSSNTGKEKKIIGGNATERALLSYVFDKSCDLKVKELNSIPFNSTNKYSATYVEGDFEGTLLKGAPEKILKKCKYCYDSQGQKQPFDSTELNQKIDALANRAIRVLAVATAAEKLEADALPDGEWTLIGVIGIRDEVRPESKTAIKQVQQAGVQVVMITGDRKDTAVAIAKDAGVLRKEEELVFTSDELAKMSDDEIKAVLTRIRVIARALPTDKSRLVRLAQEMDLVVGMTGDGVNDSPALKKADVGFAMGGGTEVAKEAGDIVILDDNFLSIGKAILYGRTIFNSIRKFIIFQLTINVGAVIISFLSPLLGMENPLSITQILWVNLVMDTLAALAMGGEPALQRYMEEKPKKRDESILNPYMWSAILTGSIWATITGLSLFLVPALSNLFRADVGNKYLFTGYFAFFIMMAVCNAFNSRTESKNLLDNMKGNKGFVKVMLLIIVVQIIMTYFGGAILRGFGLNIKEWMVVVLLALTIIPIDLVRKCFFSKKTL